jgi:hypothetical protein
MATPGWIVAHGRTGSPGPGDLEESQQKTHFPEWLGTAQWLADGSIQTQVSRLAPLIGGPVSGEPEVMDVRYRFGLPERPPDQRWREEDKLPIYHARWECVGIRFTQIVLMSRIESGEVMPAGKIPADAVMLVQLTGLSVASEYTDATAAFQVEMEGDSLDLHLDGGMVRPRDASWPLFLAAVHVPAEGIETHAGPQIRFRGHMPPGTFGAMTIKIPLAPLEGRNAFERLQDLEFDEEFRRVKRFWKSRLEAAPGDICWPILAEPAVQESAPNP